MNKKQKSIIYNNYCLIYLKRYFLITMTDYWSGREYGYDQIGTTDPYYDITRTRFSMSPDEIINLNTPVFNHNHKKTYEEMSSDNHYQNLLINLQNNKNELRRIKSQIRKIKEKESKSHTEFFHNDNNNKNEQILNPEMFILILFVCIVFIVLQMQLQETNKIIRELLLHGRIKSN